MSKMNSTVLCVKRKINDFPLRSLMIGCKRPRTQSPSDSSDPDVETIAQFAGTLLDRNEDIYKFVPTIIMHCDNLELKSSKRRTDDENESNHLTKKAKWIDVNSIVEKVKVSKYEKKEKDEHSSNELGTDSKDASQAASQNASEEEWMTFIDVEDSWSNSQSMFTRQGINARCVYDLYYVKAGGNIWSDNDKICVQLPEFRSNPIGISDDEFNDESSDSNSESNRRNDYPDTDSDSEVSGESCDNSEDKSASKSSDTSSLDDNLSASSYINKFPLSPSMTRKIWSLHVDYSSSSSSENLSLPCLDSE